MNDNKEIVSTSEPANPSMTITPQEHSDGIEQALRHTERRLTALLDQLPYVILYETGGGREYISPNIEKLLGYSAEEFAQNAPTFVSLIHPSDNAIMEPKLRQWNLAGRPGLFNMQFRIRKRSGEYIWLEDQIVGNVQADGTQSMIGVMVDVTTRRQAQQRYQAIVEAADRAGIGLGIFVSRDDVPKTLYLNDAAISIGNWTVDEIKDRSILELLSPTSWPEIQALWDRFLAGEPVAATIETMVHHKDGHYVPVSAGFSTTTLEDEFAVIAFITDITERKQTEAALIAAKLEAEEISNIKSNILSNFSHELRTPMHSILGFTSLLTEELQQPELVEYARSIQRSGERLLLTLTSIIEIASLEADPQQIELVAVDLKSLLGDIVHRFRPQAYEKGLSIETHLGNEDVIVAIDPERFRKAIDKVLANALKFTMRGSIAITLAAEIHESKHGNLQNRAVITIADSGVGMSEEFVRTAFETFNQESSGYSRSYEGTGLGLTLAKGYLHLMNAEISLDSKPGLGTTVKVSFPIAPKA